MLCQFFCLNFEYHKFRIYMKWHLIKNIFKKRITAIQHSEFPEFWYFSLHKDPCNFRLPKSIDMNGMRWLAFYFKVYLHDYHYKHVSFPPKGNFENWRGEFWYFFKSWSDCAKLSILSQKKMCQTEQKSLENVLLSFYFAGLKGPPGLWWAWPKSTLGQHQRGVQEKLMISNAGPICFVRPVSGPS